jgi:plasmid stabilization system protein ParE
VNIVWSGNARNDIKQLNAYISQDSPFYAQQFIQRLLAKIEGLQSFPSLGRRVPEVDCEDIREIVSQG